MQNAAFGNKQHPVVLCEIAVSAQKVTRADMLINFNAFSKRQLLHICGLLTFGLLAKCKFLMCFSYDGRIMISLNKV